MGVFLFASSGIGASPLEPPDPTRYMRWGPLLARPGLRVYNVGYNSNIFNSIEPTGDLVATVAPRLEGLFRFGDGPYLTFDAQLRYNAYLNYSEINYLDGLAGARVTAPFQQFGIFAGINYSRIRYVPIDAVDIRPIERRTSFDLGMLFELGWRSTLEVSGRFTDWTHGDSDFPTPSPDRIDRQLDRVERATRLTFSRGLSNLSSATLSFSRIDTDFDYPNPSGIPGQDRDATDTRIVPGLVFRPGGALVGSFQLGYAALVSVGTGIPDYRGPVVEAQLAYHPQGRTRFSLEGWRRLEWSVTLINSYFVYDGGRVTAIHFLNSIFGLEGEIGYGRLSFSLTDREDTLSNVRLGCRFRGSENFIRQRNDYTITINRVELRSNQPIRDRDQWRVEFGADFAF